MRRLNLVGDVVVDECCSPDRRAAHAAGLAEPQEVVHRIADPCAAAAEALKAQAASPVSPAIRENNSPRDLGHVRPLPQSLGVQPVPLRPRGRRKGRPAPAAASGQLSLRRSQTASSATDRQHATVQQADGTYQTSMSAHSSVVLDAIRELQQHAAPSSATGPQDTHATSDSIRAVAAEALAAAQVPLTAAELALCIRQNAHATAADSEPVRQVLQV